MSYGYNRIVQGDFEEIDTALRDALMEQGFGVITEIDVKSTMKEKLDVEYLNYHILGACNPLIAHSALQEDLEIGLLLPCNVIIRKNSDQTISVSAIDAEKMLAVAGGDGLNEFAVRINRLLKSALDSL